MHASGARLLTLPSSTAIRHLHSTIVHNLPISHLLPRHVGTSASPVCGAAGERLKVVSDADSHIDRLSRHLRHFCGLGRTANNPTNACATNVSTASSDAEPPPPPFSGRAPGQSPPPSPTFPAPASSSAPPSSPFVRRVSSPFSEGAPAYDTVGHYRISQQPEEMSPTSGPDR